MKRYWKNAFTLIELLVVVAIMVILEAILFPVLAEARDAACRTRCLSNLHQLAMAHLMYVQDSDDTLPSWQIRGPGGIPLLWTEFLSPYYRDARLLDQGLTSPGDKAKLGWIADYALCAWGPGGKGTAIDPYWRWPGCPSPQREGGRSMRLAEIPRPWDAMQITDGFTLRYNRFQANCTIRRRHRNGLLIGSFLDGRARVITETEWNRVSQGSRGFFYTIGAADR